MVACKLCGQPAELQWQRRPTDAELADLDAQETAWRDLILANSDPANPPVFGPMPDATNTTMPVYACTTHAITGDLAALIHQASCTAPDMAYLPSCNCTPEPMV